MAPENDAAVSGQPASLEYWKAMDGELYEAMIRDREVAGARAYQQQEALLTRLSDALLGARESLDVLEVGCGFGRHASYLAVRAGVRYHGFDISTRMVQPLEHRLKAMGLDTAERLLVGDTLDETVGARRFDLLFTVSVLIHNPPERLPALLESMGRVLKPGGLICLVENRLMPVDVHENDWHSGCWLHDYLAHIPAGWQLFLGQGLVDTHDLYLLRQGDGPHRVFELPTDLRKLDSARPLSIEELAARALPKLRQWAGTLPVGPRPSASPGADPERAELERVESHLLQQKRRLAGLADELAAFRLRKSPGKPALTETTQPQDPLLAAFDLPEDTRWTLPVEGFTRALHVFHHEWHGIRAAAGYLPGHKLVIPFERKLRASELRQILDTCSHLLVRRVLFHGFSDNMDELVTFLRRSAGPELKLLAVWHGNSAQFHHTFELEVLGKLLRLRAAGALEGLVCVKPGMHELSALIRKEHILNVPPRLEVPEDRGTQRAAFLPVPNDWRKNFYTNLYALDRTGLFDRLFVTTGFVEQREIPLHSQVVRVPRPERSQVFRLLRSVDLLANVSLSECQPMTSLEALAHRVPALTGPLGLGALDQHPYQRLAQVSQVDNLEAVRSAVEAILAERRRDPAGLRQSMGDYETSLRAEAVLRLQEFVLP